MEQLKKDIQNGQFQTCYLLYGEETYLKRQYKRRLTEALLPGGDSMNSSRFEGKGISVPGLIDLAETLPFFSERRLILIENSGFFKSASSQLADYLPDAPGTTVFVFVEEEVDRRNKLYKTVKSLGRAVSFDRQKEDVLERWVLGILKRENKKISRQALRLFFSKTGLDMEIIHQELEKLLCYCLQKDTVTPEDIEAVCTAQTPDQIFEMINAISARQTRQAIERYYDLLLHREPPLRILALLVRQLHVLLRLKDMERQGYAPSVIQQRSGLPSFVARRCLSQASRFTMAELTGALEACASTEEDIKTGRIADRMGVELLIVTCSS